MKKNKVLFLWLMVVLCTAVEFMLTSCTNKEESKTDYTVIETPYCTLQYPEKWRDYLSVSQSEDVPLVISYCAQLEGKDQQLFDIGFDSEIGDHIGSIQIENGESVDVYIVIHPVDLDESWNGEEKDIIISMQEDLNHIIQALPLLKEPAQQEIEETTPPETITVTAVYEDIIIETSYGNLYYPGEWEHLIHVVVTQEEDYAVEFYVISDTQQRYHLFDVFFTDNLENVVGVLNTVDGQTIGVGINIYPITVELESDEDHIEMLRNIQESVNYVIQKLPLEDLPEAAEEEPQPTQMQEMEYADMTVETPYGQLKCSGKWDNQIRIELDDSELYTATFYGKVNKKPEQHLFTITFNVGEDDAVAFVIDAEQQQVGISIIPGDIIVDDSWSEEEVNIIYAMQEEINYVLENLQVRLK